MGQDMEKDGDSRSPAHEHQVNVLTPPTSNKTLLQRWESTLIKYNVEGRGIQRVLPHERHAAGSPQTSLGQISLLWFSINLAANNLTLGMLGPSIFRLSFLDSTLLSVFGMFVGCLPVAYISTFGPSSGLRAMVLARYSMGWRGAKLVVVLNIIVALGYCLIDAVIAGQILSVVSKDDSMSVVVGIVIVSVITWAITTFGYSIVHWYERYSWIPQMVVLCILAGVAGPNFNLSSAPYEGVDSRTLTGNSISFFSLCLSAAITYAGIASDFFVYYPENTSKVKVFCVTMIGLSLSFTFTFMLGIGLATGVTTDKAWSSALDTSQGALIVAGYSALGNFGNFCSVIVALGLIANMTAPTYVAGVDFQVLGQWFYYVPRFVWNTLGVIIYTICGIAGRESLATIFTDFLALMGYWVSIWVAIMLEEHLIFYKGMGKVRFNWENWNDRTKLPFGGAAVIAFLIGWAGAILCMAQKWYIGPIAKEVGEYGADMGNYVGFAWAALVYPPLRWLELKILKRDENNFYTG
ncbi:permease for cytosine/purines, uracil, thiamine, allantoin-domain-containing protein [Terfezia claveryi]|nr:permease for cytosine/purines, uracil, thiamine, allantoin-domain-containing protein [Terfezia claveryi]